MGNSYESFDQPLREFMPAGFADVQSHDTYPLPKSHRTPRETVPVQTAVEPPVQPREAKRADLDNAREIARYLQDIGARIEYVRTRETSGVASTANTYQQASVGSQSDYGLAG